MKAYCLGFLFTPDWDKVVLIRKNRPTWQNGKLNGVGGKLMADEGFVDAMIREFHEETGVYTEPWDHAFILNSCHWTMHVFTSASEYAFDVKTKTDESVGLYQVNRLPPDILPNLRWMIPLCTDSYLHKPILLMVQTPVERIFNDVLLPRDYQRADGA